MNLIESITSLDAELYRKFTPAMGIAPHLTRSLVSFQGNRNRAGYWYKYKEGFAHALAEQLLVSAKLGRGATIIDPFAGNGTTLFAAGLLGFDSVGIELLPVGKAIIEARILWLEGKITPDDLSRFRQWGESQRWESYEGQLVELPITRNAYTPATATAIGGYIEGMRGEPPAVRSLLRVALLSSLESVSFTRKDGQCLRWDKRSGRGGKFDKGVIPEFAPTIKAKIEQIARDIISLELPTHLGQSELLMGSSLDVMPTLPGGTFGTMLTSPPYCNRYDYTRIYALELAAEGMSAIEVKALRHALLTATVENKEKDLLALNPSLEFALDLVRHHPLLQTILTYLDQAKEHKALNNGGIPRMVRGYFTEMACILAESRRILADGAPLFMVNDNVRYAGVSIPVDLILCDIAQGLGFQVEQIMVLPQGKGNSSQQMGLYGRHPLRKCIYVLRAL
jgi:hypothetical protein